MRSFGDELRYQRVAVGPVRCTDELCRYTFEPPILAAFCSSFALHDNSRSRCLTSLLNSRTARRRSGNWTLLRLTWLASTKLRQSTHPSSNLCSTNFHNGVSQEHCVLRNPPERVTRNYSMVGRPHAIAIRFRRLAQYTTNILQEDLAQPRTRARRIERLGEPQTMLPLPHPDEPQFRGRHYGAAP